MNKLPSQFSLHSTNPKKMYNAKDLFGDSNEIIIKFNNEEYRLRITKNEKLVMNK